MPRPRYQRRARCLFAILGAIPVNGSTINQGDSMNQPQFKPQFFVSDLVVMNGDNKAKYCTDKISKVTFPGSVLIYEDYSEVIGMATLKIEGKKVLADCYFSRAPLGYFPSLQGEPSELWHPDEPRERVVALGDQDDNVMICEVEEDDKLNFTSLVFTNLAPLDTRIKALAQSQISPFDASELSAGV